MARPHNRTTIDLSTAVPDCAGVGLRDYMRAVEGECVAEAFKLAQGSRPDAAQLLGVSERTLRYLIAKHLRVRPRPPVASRRRVAPVASALIVALAIAVSATRISATQPSAVPTTAAAPASSTSLAPVAAHSAATPPQVKPVAEPAIQSQGAPHATP